MILLHAGLNNGQLLLWAETPSPAEAQPIPTRSRRSSKPPRPQPLPFALQPNDLAGALETTFPGWKKLAAHKAVILWVPTLLGNPIPSSPLIAPPPEDASTAVLAPWQIDTLPLTPPQAIDLLSACLDQTNLAPGVIVGSTLAYLALVLRFAGVLAAREEFLPNVEPTGASWRASWKPTPTGVDRQRFNQLAQAMPAACRALSATADRAPDVSAALVLAELVAVLVDQLVRAQEAAGLSARPIGRPSKKASSFDSLHDQWLHALRSPEGTLQGTGTELAGLAEQVAAWQRPAAVAVAAPFRLCFRLEEPAAAENGQKPTRDPWTVRYLLQAQDDLSLLIPVTDAWAPRGRTKAILQRNGFQPREFLLTTLGQAASLAPPIEASLKNASPSEFTTDLSGAHGFLTETARLLEQAGFGVLLPAWWTGKGTKQKLTVRAHVRSSPMQGGSGLTLETLVKFDWQVAIGQHTLTLKELEALARLKAPLVRVRGQWVEVNAEELQAALDFWKKQEAGQVKVGELVQMALGAKKAPGGLPITGVSATGWVEEFLARLEGRATFAELLPPTGLQGTLRPYQVRGYSWLNFLHDWGLGACLADDMGLGKTVQTLALIQRDWEAGRREPTLLVCPMSVVGNWKKEAERFTPQLPVLIHHGLKRFKGTTFTQAVKKHALVLTSYGLLHRDLALFQAVKWAGVILDEAQNVKNPETKQAKGARALTAAYRIALTGTPVENHVGDLWSIWQFLNPGFLGNQAEFRRAFFIPIQVRHDAPAAERLKKLTGPFLLRRLKTDKAVIADLPDKQEMKVYCNLTKEQASLYAAVVNDLDKNLKAVDGIKRKGVILGTLSKLKQVCNHPAQFLGDRSAIPNRSGKLARLTEMLDEMLQAADDRALIFTQFTEMGEIIKKHLQETFGREVLFLHGGVARKQRDQMVARFQAGTGSNPAADAPRLFLLSLKAGGTGLNLTAANHVFHFDRWWNPAVENQATDRAFRIGQTRNLQVHKFICVGTLEDMIDEMLERKKAVAERVVGTGEAWLTEMSNEQLKDLLKLRQQAMEE